MQTMRRHGAWVLAWVVAGCASQAPIHYRNRQQTTWTMPIAAPLDDGRIVVPASIHGKGPYWFVLDPSSPSLIDRKVAEDLDLYTRGAGSWTVLRGIHEARVYSRPYEVIDMQVGDLELYNIVLRSLPTGRLKEGGRPIHGVLGGDIFARSMVIDVDRDAGLVKLTVGPHFRPPAGARRVPTAAYHTFLVPSRVDGRPLVLLVDLAAKTSALWPRVLTRMGLHADASREMVVDSFGNQVVAGGAVRARAIDIGGVLLEDVRFLAFEPNPYLKTVTYDGILGQNVLARFRTIVDLDSWTLWLAPRANDLASTTPARLRRWGERFVACENAGCVKLDVSDSGDRLWVRPESAASPDPYALYLEAVDESGATTAAPLVRVEVAAKPVAVILDPRYLGAHAFRVVDATPFGVL